MAFIVTPEDLDRGAASCRSVNSEVQAQIARMRSYVDSLTTVYLGPASVTLRSVSDEWGVDAQQLNMVLNSIADGLATAGRNYQDSDDTALTRYRNAGAGLPSAKF